MNYYHFRKYKRGQLQAISEEGFSPKISKIIEEKIIATWSPE